MFLLPSDFTKGFYKIASDCYTEDDLQEYINKYEKCYLIDLLGCDLYNLFVADLDVPTAPPTPVPQTPRFIEIYNEFCVDDPNACDEVWKSEGMIEMLKGFVYFHYVRDYKFKTTTTGTIVNNNEVSREAQSMELINGLSERFNAAQSTYWSIRRYIIDKGDVIYPEFNGRKIAALSFGGAF